MTAIHQKTDSSPYGLAADQVTFPCDGHDIPSPVTLAHYPRINTLAVAIDGSEVASLDLKEFKKFARKVLADELAEPPAPDWHDAQVIRGKQLGRTRYFLSDRDGGFLTDSGIAWSPEILADNISDIEIVVGADDE